MSFIFFLLFLVISVAAVILVFVLGVLRSIFGFGRKRSTFPGEEAFDKRASGNQFEQKEDKPKIFSEKEGEYVDYEEIDD